MTIQLDRAGRELVARHGKWWQRQENLHMVGQGQPLGDLWLPLADGTVATEDIMVTPEILDVERLVGEPLEPGALEVHGDRFAVRAPYGRIPWVEAILGCPIHAQIQGGSMRAQSSVREWAEWENRPVHRSDEWFNLMMHLIETMAARSGGRYAIVQPTMRGPTDLAEAVLGPQMMCLSMYDPPDRLRAFLEEVTDVFIEVLHAQLARFPQVDGGYVSAYGVWAPGSVVRTQCDASAILSPRQYAEWFMPYDERICRSVDVALMHLHSTSLHTIDVLLEMDALDAFEITMETSAGAPTLQQMVPVFRKILAKKALILYGPLSEDEEQYLLRELPHDGLFINARRLPW
ncbi:MAG TPA: hypothetical protein GX714_16575 [Chloroflexi bacterium]|jgi:hypothetical protein|nr:hypothetical protein [Chloroflexota bacterium]